MATEAVPSPEGVGLVSGGNGYRTETDLIGVGRELERGEQLENFVGNMVFPRYQTAKKLLDVSAKLTKKKSELGGSELNKSQKTKRELLDQIRENRKDVKKTEEINTHLEAIEKGIESLKKGITGGTVKLREEVKTITADRKAADVVIVQGLNSLGYRI